MGLWGAIKKTLNSTLGTADFKPLDKIIEGQRTLAASDSVIQVIFSSPENVPASSYSEMGRFMTYVDGNVRILTEFDPSGGMDETFYIRVSSDTGEVIAEKHITAEEGVNQNVSVDVTIRKNRIYTIKAKTTRNGDMMYLKIGANIVDTSLVEVV